MMLESCCSAFHLLGLYDAVQGRTTDVVHTTWYMVPGKKTRMKVRFVVEVYNKYIVVPV